MAAYKDLVGQKITKVTSNPGEPKTGQMWYNSTAGVLRGLGITAAWASSAPLITAKHALGGAGTQTAAIIFGGVPALTTTEEYNGSGFNVGGTLNTGRSYMAGCGTQTAGLGFGGYTTSPNTQGQALTEEYNGTSWSESGDLDTSRYSIGAAGTQTAGLAFGGYNNGLPPGNVTNKTEEYNGTIWTVSPGTLGTARYEMAGAGLQTAAVAALGYKYGSPLRTTSTEEYDGSTWSAGANATTERSALKGGGIQTSFLVFGGFAPPDSAATEAYDGTSWTNQPNLATARRRMGQASNTSNNSTGLCVGGQTPPSSSITEEFTSSTNVITAGAWASGANQTLNTYGRGGCGSTTAGLLFGGYQPSSASRTETETFDGTSYSEVSDMSTGRRYVAGFGTQTAAVCAAGNTPPGFTTVVEEWDGSSWTANPNGVPTAVSTARGTGTATAGLIFGGSTPSVTANTQTFDGTSFTEVSDLNSARSGVGGAGTQTATLAYGGRTGPPGIVTNTESWNGSAWTNSPTPLVTERNNMGAAGTSTEAWSIAGNSGPTATQNLNSQLYNGTTWITQPNLSIARSYLAGFGTTGPSAIGAGGYGPAINPDRTRTEEFTAETTAANIADFTTS